MSLDLDQPMAALPLTVFTYATGPYEEWHRYAWAAALVLILVVFVLSLGARLAIDGGSRSMADATLRVAPPRPAALPDDRRPGRDRQAHRDVRQVHRGEERVARVSRPTGCTP